MARLGDVWFAAEVAEIEFILCLSLLRTGIKGRP